MNKLIDMLEDNEDVQNTYHNWETEDWAPIEITKKTDGTPSVFPYSCEQDCKPGSVSGSHLSRRRVAAALQPPRERSGRPWGAKPLLPYRCCSG